MARVSRRGGSEKTSLGTGGSGRPDSSHSSRLWLASLHPFFASSISLVSQSVRYLMSPVLGSLFLSWEALDPHIANPMLQRMRPCQTLP